MLTTTCILRHGDRQATARLSTASPQATGKVEYEGDLTLFPRRFARLRNDDLRQMARNIKRTTDRQVEIQDSGKYESFAR